MFLYLNIRYSCLSLQASKFDLSGRSVLFHTDRWASLLLEIIADRKSFVVRRMISTTDNTPDITFFPASLACQLVICALHASRAEMTIIFGIPMSSIFCIIGGIHFASGRFELCFVHNLHCKCFRYPGQV